MQSICWFHGTGERKKELSMKISRRSMLALTAGVVLAGVPEAQAAGLSPTTIYVKNIHCANCASKIARKLYTVPGVSQVATSVKSHMARVTPSQRQAPSPQKMWEAVEAAGFEVVKLSGPQGTFTVKPGI